MSKVPSTGHLMNRFGLYYVRKQNEGGGYPRILFIVESEGHFCRGEDDSNLIKSPFKKHAQETLSQRMVLFI